MTILKFQSDRIRNMASAGPQKTVLLDPFTHYLNFFFKSSIAIFNKFFLDANIPQLSTGANLDRSNKKSGL